VFGIMALCTKKMKDLLLSIDFYFGTVLVTESITNSKTNVFFGI